MFQVWGARYLDVRKSTTKSHDEDIPVHWEGKSRGTLAFGPRRGSHSLASFSLSSANFCRLEETNDFQSYDATSS